MPFMYLKFKSKPAVRGVKSMFADQSLVIKIKLWSVSEMSYHNSGLATWCYTLGLVTMDRIKAIAKMQTFTVRMWLTNRLWYMGRKVPFLVAFIQRINS